MKKSTATQINIDELPDRKLVGANIVEHMKHAQNAHDATLNHFRYKSKLVRAIQDHCVNATDCLLIDKGERQISCHRGTGYAVSIREALAPFAMPGECQMIWLTFSVGFSPLPDDAEYNGYDGGHDIEKRMDVNVPADLELHFTQEKFNLWLNTTIRELRHKERDANNLKDLQKLLLKYPKQGREFLKKMKKP
jgi:hypothetical protein